jgi:hypothetical protein
LYQFGDWTGEHSVRYDWSEEGGEGDVEVVWSLEMTQMMNEIEQRVDE